MLLHEGRDLGRVLPVRKTRLVAADMDYVRREERRHLVQHVVQELLDLGVGQLVEVAPNAVSLDT